MPSPGRDCPLCPRLSAFRTENRRRFPDFHNAPVPEFGPGDASLLVLGLAPGLKGANRTGRPFTGDYAGELLYSTLLRFGFAEGTFAARSDDGLRLIGCRVSNAVRCVPPGNRPETAEIAACNGFLKEEIAALPRLRAVFALGAIAHQAFLRALDLRPAHFPFAHGASHRLPGGRTLVDSYHCSRLNTNTGRLSEAMFHEAFARAAEAARAQP